MGNGNQGPSGDKLGKKAKQALRDKAMKEARAKQAKERISAKEKLQTGSKDSASELSRLAAGGVNITGKKVKTSAPGEQGVRIPRPAKIWGATNTIKMADGSQITVNGRRADPTIDGIAVFSNGGDSRTGAQSFLIAHTPGFAVSVTGAAKSRVMMHACAPEDLAAFSDASATRQQAQLTDLPIGQDKVKGDIDESTLSPKAKTWRSAKQKMVEHLNKQGIRADDTRTESQWLAILNHEFRGFGYTDRPRVLDKFSTVERKMVKEYLMKLGADIARRELTSTSPRIGPDDGRSIPDDVMQARRDRVLADLDRILGMYDMIAAMGGVVGAAGAAGARGGRRRTSGKKKSGRRSSGTESPSWYGRFYNKRGNDQEEIVEALFGFPKNNFELRSIHPRSSASKVVPDFMFRVNRNGTFTRVRDPARASVFAECKLKDGPVKLTNQTLDLIAHAARRQDKSVGFILGPNTTIAQSVYREARAHGVEIRPWNVDFVALPAMP